MLTVVKIGGAWLEAGPKDEAFEALARLPGDLVVVHGGGSEVSRWLERAGIQVEWVKGLRVTRGDSLQLTAMVLSGWVNKEVVRALERAGRRSVGISGEDGGLLLAEHVDVERFGEVGRVVSVNPEIVHLALRGGFTPVISPISKGPDRQPLNVNADESAIPIALSLGADRLLLLSDVPGVLADGELVEALDREKAAVLERTGHLVGGMLIKVNQALDAAEVGVEVRIGDASLLTSESGTRISSSEIFPTPSQ
jgi:acetylglutamate kinase